MTREHHLDWDGCFNVRDLAAQTDEEHERERLYRENDGCRPEVVLSLLERLDAHAYLRDGGADLSPRAAPAGR